MLRNFTIRTLVFLFFTIMIGQAAVAQQAQTYESSMQSGNERFNAGDFISAKTYYEMALRLREDDAAAKQKLNETISKIGAQMEKQERFYFHLDHGDRLNSEGKITEALEAYNKALGIFPDDKYTKAQTDKIRQILAEEEATQNAYNQAMRSGIQLLEDKEFEEAIQKFEEAKAIFPDRNEPAEKMTEAKKLLEQQLALEQSFQQLKDEAEAFLIRRNYTAAIEKLEEALVLFPEDATTLNQLKNAQEALVKSEKYEEMLAEADAAYEKKELEEAKVLYAKALDFWPDQTYPNDMIRRIDDYFKSDAYLNEVALNQYLEEAEQQYRNEQWKLALSSYNKVLDINPDHELAIERISELSFLIKQQEELAQQEEQFNQLIQKGDDAYAQQAFTDAISFYKEAVQLIESDEVSEKIKAAEQQLAAAAALAEKESRYDELIAQSDEKIDAEEWQAAKQFVEQAIAILADRTEANERLLLINSKLESIAQELAQTDADYQLALTEGIQAFADRNFDQAITSFEKAAQLKPEEQLPQQKIAEVKQEQERENEFTQLITTAEAYFADNKLHEALDSYRNALSIYSEREEAKNRVQEIERMLNQAKAEQELLDNFNQLIATADQQYSNKQLAEAKQSYNQALALIATEAYPREQIQKIDNELRAIAEAEELEQNYTAHIKQGDQLKQEKEWEQAIGSYQNALALKADESYPQQQIQEINNIIEELAAADALEKQISSLTSKMNQDFAAKAYDDALVSANKILELDPSNITADARKAEIELTLAALAKEREQKYTESMQLGNELVLERSYQQAITAYKTALGYKKEDPEAKERIKQVEQIIQERLLEIKTAYDKHITDADRFYKNGNLDMAIEAYLKAENTKPDESYPREKIKEIAEMMEANKMREVLTTATIIEDNISKRYNFEPIDVVDRRSNYILIKAKNLSENAFPLLVNYGSSTGKNGGFVLPIPENDEVNDFIIRIGSQYKWFSEDNIWLELLPENGNIELHMIQITKGN